MAIAEDFWITGFMQAYVRILEHLWPFRRLFFLSIVCAVFVSLLWAVNLYMAYPVITVLFKNDSLHAYTEAEIRQAEESIAAEQAQLQKLSPEQVEQQARVQARLSRASYNLLVATWVRDTVLPFVPRDKFDTMVLIMAVLLVATALKDLFIYMEEILVGSVVQLTVNSIRQACFRSALRLDFQSVNRIGTASLMSRMTNDIEQMTATIRIFGVSMIREPLKALVCTAVAFWLNWRLTLLTVTIVPLLGYIMYRFGKKLRDASHRTMQSMQLIYQCISETFQSSKIVIAFSGFRRHRKQFFDANRIYYRDSMRIVRTGALVRPITELLATIALFAALFPGAYLVLRNTNELWGIQLAAEPMGIEQLGTLYTMLLGTLDPMRKLSGIFSIIKRGMAGSDRVFALIDEETAVREPVTPRMLVRHSQSITFQNVSFRYDSPVSSDPQRPLALKDVNLEFRFGEVVAVVGGNGSGKSTLVSLLPRFVDPVDGAVLIDGADIREYRTQDLRQQIGLVTQETLLFNDSIYENIRYGHPEASPADIEEAARRAQALSFIEQLPDGFRTSVGDKGSRLSGGQRQRIALARAIVRDPAILILDEATSAVDSASEEIIHRVLKEFAVGRTMFIISHVLSRAFLDLVNRIVVMDQGRVVATGSHGELMSTCPTYRALQLSHAPVKEAA
jgi:subfamily B ATP-binding cassette protein MsbA